MTNSAEGAAIFSGEDYNQFSVRPPLLVTVGPLDGWTVVVMPFSEPSPLVGAVRSPRYLAAELMVTTVRQSK